MERVDVLKVRATVISMSRNVIATVMMGENGRWVKWFNWSWGVHDDVWMPTRLISYAVVVELSIVTVVVGFLVGLDRLDGIAVFVHSTSIPHTRSSH